MKTYTTTLVVLLLCINSLYAQESNAPKFGKGLFNLKGEDNSWSMKIGARMQFLATSSWDSEDNGVSNVKTSMLVRRARLKFSGFAFSPKLEYKLELGLSNKDIGGASIYTNDAPRYILDAVVKWNFHENFVLWVGQTKLPGNRERVISSANMQLVDRSLLNKRFNIDRDMGIQLRHHFNISDNFIVKEAFSIAQGEGRNVTTGNLGGFQYTARVELLPFGNFTGKGDYVGGDLKREENLKWAFAASYDLNNNAVKNRSNQGSYMTNDVGFYQTNVSTLFVDTMLKYKGFSFMGEYALRDAADPLAKNSDNSLTGDKVQTGNSLNLMSGYLFKNNVELTGRYTNVNYDKFLLKGAENQYTIGLSKYIAGHKLKVQSDISYLDVVSGKNQLMYRFQVDIHF
ncbi:MAG: porin [Polaribacter sp.]|nr:porin [Polaribacter sp.]MDG1810455.1 porin [Polaribacter sp.]MDG1993897.1 porin [Polaribacter sp.]